jgi:uncharacterized protein YndB with AHSA1/START domain
MHLVVEERIPASPLALWPLLTDPPRMNAWSEARIASARLGDGRRTDGVGAHRIVSVRGSTFHEVIAESEPPRRLVYCIFRGVSLLREHRGEILLFPEDSGTRLRWEVRVDFALPGLSSLTRAAIVEPLRRSVRALARVAQGADEVPLSPGRPTIPRAALEPLRAAAEAALEEQLAIAARLTDANDPKQWFARVYAITTELQLDHLPEVDHPEWVLRLIPRFHEDYARNLRRWEQGRRDEVDPLWASAYRAAEQGDPEKSPDKVILGLLLGVRAHIEEDLPGALADTYLDHFRDRCDYARFRADYVRMTPLFRRVSDRLLDQMPPRFLPPWLRAIRTFLPLEAVDALAGPRVYEVAPARLAAFERGARLAAWKLGAEP